MPLASTRIGLDPAHPCPGPDIHPVTWSAPLSHRSWGGMEITAPAQQLGKGAHVVALEGVDVAPEQRLVLGIERRVERLDIEARQRRAPAAKRC